MSSPLQFCLEEWQELEKEFENLEVTHKDYCAKVAEVKAVQKKCMSSIAHQRYRIKQILESLKKSGQTDDPEDKKKITQLQQQINERKNQFRELEENLPHENGIYLKVILGSVNVSLLSKEDKYKYKEDYERFKLYVTVVTMVFSVIIWFFVQYRWTDAGFQFLLVWYYCTLTIREHILKVNGSRIKGWWVTHHFISTFCAGILLIWPEGYTYQQFRGQFVVFCWYLSVVQLVQYYYQSGCLYRLKALGERRNMDITVEGFQSWMWKGLTFVLPFLVGGYIFQLYNAYVLFRLTFHPECVEWQVLGLGLCFLTLGLGNALTTFKVVRQKLVTEKWRERLEIIVKNKKKQLEKFATDTKSRLQNNSKAQTFQ